MAIVFLPSFRSIVFNLYVICKHVSRFRTLQHTHQFSFEMLMADFTPRKAQADHKARSLQSWDLQRLLAKVLKHLRSIQIWIDRPYPSPSDLQVGVESGTYGTVHHTFCLLYDSLAQLNITKHLKLNELFTRKTCSVFHRMLKKAHVMLSSIVSLLHVWIHHSHEISSLQPFTRSTLARSHPHSLTCIHRAWTPLMTIAITHTSTHDRPLYNTMCFFILIKNYPKQGNTRGQAMSCRSCKCSSKDLEGRRIKSTLFVKWYMHTMAHEFLGCSGP